MDENKQPTIAEEAGLPANWEPIDVKPIIPGQQPANSGSSTAPLVGSLPPSYQQNTDFSGVGRASGHVPQLSLMPLGIQGNPATNAAVTSTATKAAQSIPSAPSQTVSIGLSMPVQYSVAGTPADATGDFIVTWLPEPATYFLAGPNQSISLYVDAFTKLSDSSASITISATPVQSAQDFAMLFTAQDVLATAGAFNPGAPWSSAFSASNAYTAYTQQLSSLATATATGALSPSQSWSSVLVLFSSNGAASVLNTSTLNSGNFGGGSSATPSVTAASALILARYSGDLTGGPQTVTGVSDTQGNTWYNLAFVDDVSGSGTSMAIWFAPNAVGGANTVTWTASGNSSGDMEYFEVSNLTGLPGIVSFRAITGADLPLPSASSPGAVYSKALVTHEFLTSLGTNGRFGQAQPDFTDLSGNIAVTQVNSGTNANGDRFFCGNNTWSRLGILSLDETAQGGNIPLTNFPGLPSVETGVYRINVYCIVTTVAGISSTLPDFQFGWTDGSNTTAQTVDFVATNPTGNSLTTYFEGSAIFRINSGHGTLSYQTGATLSYASAGAPSMTYDIFFRIEAL